jgi:hypothetical protein
VSPDDALTGHAAGECGDDARLGQRLANGARLQALERRRDRQRKSESWKKEIPPSDERRLPEAGV